MGQTTNLRQVGERIETLLAELGVAEPRVLDKTQEVVRLLVELYGAALEHVVALLDGEPAGTALLRRMSEDPFLSSLLVLHGLHPIPLQTRLHQALETVRPYLGSHAGGVELLGVDEAGVVRLRLQGSCDGCPSSTVTVKLAIERAILEAAPEVTRVEVEGVAEERPKLLQIQSRPGAAREVPSVAGPERVPDITWVEVASGGLPPGTTRALELEGAAVLLCNARGSLYAYRNHCPGCESGLHEANLDLEVLRCPTCHERFDVHRAGRGLDGEDQHLDPLPLLQTDGVVRIAVPRADVGAAR